MHTTRRLIAAGVALTLAGALIAPQASAGTPSAAGPGAATQAKVGGVDGFSTAPSPSFTGFDWTDRAEAFDAFAYDWTDRGVFSTIRVDNTALNMPDGQKTYKMPAYYGDQRVSTAGPNNGDGYQEAVTQLASVISATLVGIDKSAQPCNQPQNAAQTCDYVDMVQTFYRGSTTGVAGNTPTPGGDGVPGTLDGWYQFLPNVLYSMIGEQYPDAQNMDTIQRTIADKFYTMTASLGGANANFDMWDYDFETGTKYLKGTSYQSAELATATAFVLLNAYERFGTERYLTGAKWAMDSIERSTDDTYYEIVVLLAPYLAARMNALYGTDYDVSKPLRWLMDGSKVRSNWGTLGALNSPVVWGGKDVSGLTGSLSDKGPGNGDGRQNGYVFAMNSFATTWLAATAKYDTSYANAIGKWLLNVNSASRYFFADQLTAGEQWYGSDFIDGVSTGQSGSAGGWATDDRATAIAYESLQSQTNSGIRALSDVPDRSSGWGVGSDARGLGMYGSAWIGFMSVIHPTNVANVLRIDLNKLDTYGENAYPTSLVYNPTTSDQQIQIPLASGTKDLYDTVSGTFKARGASGSATVTVPAGSSVVLSEVPAGAALTRSGIATVIGGHPVAWSVSDLGDVAQHKAVTAAPADTTVSAVADGDDTTAWTADQSAERTVVVDTGKVRSLGSVTLTWGARHPTGYVVSTSADGTAWTPATTVASLGGREKVAFAAVDARYVRILIPQDPAGGPYQLRSLEARIADLARGGTVTASGTQNTLNIPAALTDGSDATRWESKTQNDQSATIDLGSVQDLSSIRVNWEGAYGKDYKVEVSPDNSTWTTAATVTGNSSAGVKTHALTGATTGRYVRWSGTARGTSYAYSMWSLEVFAKPGVTRTGQSYVPSGAVTAGGLVPVTGAGYTPGEVVTISITPGGATTTLTTDATGAFAASLAAPAAPGEYQVAVSATASGIASSSPLTVRAVVSPPVVRKDVRLSVTSVGAKPQVGKAPVLEVSARGTAGWPGGTVRVAVLGAKAVDVTVPASGTARVTLAKATSTRSLQVTVGYAGSATFKPATATRTFTVAKAKATVRVTAKKKVRTGKRVAVKVTVTAPRGVSAKGKVRVYLNGKRVATASMKASGTVTVRVTVRKTGTARLKVAYFGNASLTTASGKAAVRATR